MDWRKQRKIDGHIHLLPDEVHDANPGDDSELGFAKALSHLKNMDEYNIEKAVIMTFNDPFLMSMDFTVSAVHENLKRLCRMRPGKYYAFADVDVRNAPEVTCRELRKALLCDCFKGIKLHPNNAGMNIDDAYNDSIFELAAEFGVPIAIHSYPSGKKSMNRTDYCSPHRIARIMKRHPQVSVIICHMGGFQWEDCMKLNAYFDFSAILPDWVDEYGITGANEILRKFRIDKLIFATDWPCSRSRHPSDIYPKYMEYLNQMDFSEDEVERISYSNIAQLLKL